MSKKAAEKDLIAKLLPQIKDLIVAELKTSLENSKQGSACSSTGNDIDGTMPLALAQALENISNNLLELKKEMSDMKSSMQFFNEQFEAITQRMNETEKKCSQNVGQITSILRSNKINQDKIHQIDTQTEEMDRRQRLEYLEFHGIPSTPNEDPVALVTGVCNYLSSGSGITKEDITTCHRKYKAVEDKKTPPIIVKFSTHIMRDTVYGSRSTLHSSADPNAMKNVFIVENLTRRNMDLLFKARELKIKNQYAFLWTKNGRVHIRKNKNVPHITINNEEDLEKIK